MTAVTLFVGADDFDGICATLAPEGVDVIPTAGLDEAIQISASVIILDADRDQGWATSLQHLVQIRPTARIVVLARKADNFMWREVLTQGAHDLLQKPLLASEVCSAVLGARQKRCTSRRAQARDKL